MAIPAYYSLIQRGSSGPDVALVQTWLNGLRDACTWHDILKGDGHFGTASEKAVTEFQLRNKLTVDGKVGANTWNAIYAKYTAAHGLHVPYPGIVLRQGSEGGTVRLVQQKLRGEGETLTADQALPDPPQPDLRRLRGQGHLGKDVLNALPTCNGQQKWPPPGSCFRRGPFSLQRGNSAYLFLYISS